MASKSATTSTKPSVDSKVTDQTKNVGSVNPGTASAKASKKAEKKAAKKAARTVVRARLNEIPEKDGLRAAIITLIGDGSRSFGGGAKGESKLDKFAKLVIDAKKVDTLEAFKSLKMGIGEAKKLINKYNKSGANPFVLAYDNVGDCYTATPVKK